MAGHVRAGMVVAVVQVRKLAGKEIGKLFQTLSQTQLGQPGYGRPWDGSRLDQGWTTHSQPTVGFIRLVQCWTNYYMGTIGYLVGLRWGLPQHADRDDADVGQL